MKIAITGGTGFVGRHLAGQLTRAGHQAMLIARGHDPGDSSLRELPGVTFAQLSIDESDKLAAALAGCEAVAHCVGINRELGAQTYQRVHVEGTRSLVAVAKKAGVRKIAMLSFLRARPGCGSGYHESKWAAEEIVRESGLDYTILKSGVIYGRGDHMLDHLSHALHTFPVFAFVGFRPTKIAPVAIEDLARILYVALVDDRLSRQTVAVIGPEQLTLEAAVRRVARVVGKRPLYFSMPVWFHYGLGLICERLMKVPLVSLAQVRILSEGVVDPLPACNELPPDLAPITPFSDAQIHQGLPAPGRFTFDDLLLCHD